jgi:hypothetical protein
VADLREAIPHLKDALSDARREDLARLDDGLREFGVTGVQGEAEVGITSLLATAIRRSGQESVRVDLDGASSEIDVAWLLARGMATCAVGPANLSLLHSPESLRPLSAQRAFIDFANRAGQRIARFAFADQPEGDVGIAETLSTFPDLFAQASIPPPIWIDHLETPGLTPRHPVDVRALLWNVRALRQRMEFPIVISGHRTATPAAYDQSGAFHGDGTWITIGRPGIEVWLAVAKSLGEAAPPPVWVSEMFEHARGHPATMLLSLALFVTLDHRPASELWLLMLSLDDGHLNRALMHARTLHRLGGPVFEQIAQELGPYSEPRVPIKEIHRAVQRLHEAGLITQPRPRTWEVTNPLIGERLRRNSWLDAGEREQPEWPAMLDGPAREELP